MTTATANSNRWMNGRRVVRILVFIIVMVWLTVGASVSARITARGPDAEPRPSQTEPIELPSEWVWHLPEHRFDDMFPTRGRQD